MATVRTRHFDESDSDSDIDPSQLVENLTESTAIEPCEQHGPLTSVNQCMPSTSSAPVQDVSFPPCATIVIENSFVCYDCQETIRFGNGVAHLDKCYKGRKLCPCPLCDRKFNMYRCFKRHFEQHGNVELRSVKAIDTPSPDDHAITSPRASNQCLDVVTTALRCSVSASEQNEILRLLAIPSSQALKTIPFAQRSVQYFNCPVPGCTTLRLSRGTYVKHILSLHRYMVVPCPFCPKKFQLARSLRKHMESHNDSFEQCLPDAAECTVVESMSLVELPDKIIADVPGDCDGSTDL